MLYSLFQYLQGKVDIPGAGMFTYVTFRSMFALVASIVISAWFGSKFIDFLKRHSITETQRDEKTDPFNVAKVGVPTMGGVIIIIAILVPCLLVGNLLNPYLILMIITTLLLGAIGFADDYIKTFKKKKDGLNGWVKVAGQVLLGLIVGLTLRYAPTVVINEKVETKIENNVEVVVKTPDVKSTRTTIPFLKDHNLNYSYLNWDEIKELDNSGVIEIQSHTYNLHKNSNSRSGLKKKKSETFEQYSEFLCADAIKMKETMELIFRNSEGKDPLQNEPPIPQKWYCNK